jgi:hypothetical protein
MGLILLLALAGGIPVQEVDSEELVTKRHGDAGTKNLDYRHWCLVPTSSDSVVCAS